MLARAARQVRNKISAVSWPIGQCCPKFFVPPNVHITIRSCYGLRVSTFERDFNSAVEAVERDVFINLVCENPQLTLAELTRLGKGKFAGLISTVSVRGLPPLKTSSGRQAASGARLRPTFCSRA